MYGNSTTPNTRDTYGFGTYYEEKFSDYDEDESDEEEESDDGPDITDDMSAEEKHFEFAKDEILDEASSTDELSDAVVEIAEKYNLTYMQRELYDDCRKEMKK